MSPRPIVCFADTSAAMCKEEAGEKVNFAEEEEEGECFNTVFSAAVAGIGLDTSIAVQSCYIGALNGDEPDHYEVFLYLASEAGIAKERCTFLRCVGSQMSPEDLESLSQAFIRIPTLTEP